MLTIKSSICYALTNFCHKRYVVKSIMRKKKEPGTNCHLVYWKILLMSQSLWFKILVYFCKRKIENLSNIITVLSNVTQPTINAKEKHIMIIVCKCCFSSWCVVLELYLGYFSARFNCLLYISWLKFSGMGYLHLNMHLESLVEACNWLL